MPDSLSYRARKSHYSKMLTIYGRKPTLEALRDDRLNCRALHLADSNRQSDIIEEIQRLAQQRGILIKRHSKAELSRISKNGKQDQGVALDIDCPQFTTLDEYLECLADQNRQRLLALDGITNPANLGMIVRAATAGEIDGILWSNKGNAALGPLVLKASAGTLYRAPIIICDQLSSALSRLQEQGVRLLALAARGSVSLFDYAQDGHSVFILGNESEGISQPIARLTDLSLSIPMRNNVESLNVAVTASLIAYASLLQGRER
ncbi:MAG: RNA methyltransferase [Pseudomonadota bacterium]